ncbi:hypothetical protein L7F22_013307 [Adiantum nelumboides]|nr:hypothetical protein [Adiantum nelumboides]
MMVIEDQLQSFGMSVDDQEELIEQIADAMGRVSAHFSRGSAVCNPFHLKSAKNWKFAADQFRSKYGSEVLVHCSACNSSTLTFDGVDVMGHRLAAEVKEVVMDSPNLTKISFMAHSLGGLVARYAIGQLFTPLENMTPSNVEEQETSELLPGTILGLQPVNFITVATPHIGLKGSWQLPFLCGVGFLEKLAGWKGHCVVGRTGKHLFLADGVGSQKPLLHRMVSDCSQGLFISALHAFQRRVAYANSSYDHMVGWRTATFRREYEIPKLRRQPLDPTYPHVIHIEDVSADTEKASADKKPALDPAEGSPPVTCHPVGLHVQFDKGIILA